MSNTYTADDVVKLQKAVVDFGLGDRVTEVTTSMGTKIKYSEITIDQLISLRDEAVAYVSIVTGKKKRRRQSRVIVDMGI